MKTLIILLGAALVVSSSLSLRAEIIGVETFDYFGGANNLGNGGTFWDYTNNTATPEHTGTESSWLNVTGTPVVAGEKLATNDSSTRRNYYGGTEADGAVNDPFSSPSSDANVVYFRVDVTTGDTLPTEFLLESMDFGTARVSFGYSTSNAAWMMAEGGPSYSASPGPSPNSTYTLVAQIDYVANVIRLYVDPDLNEPQNGSSPVLDRAYTGTNWSTAVKLSSTGGEVRWDNLVVATAWEDLGVVVTTNADEDDGSLDPNLGAGISLREALEHAPNGALISFAPSLDGTRLVLTEEILEFFGNRTLTIDASNLAGGFTIDGDRRSGILETGTTTELNLNALTFINGIDSLGGAINNRGTLRARNCAFVDNASRSDGGAVYSDIFSSTQSAIFTKCTFSGNRSADRGGALFIYDGLALASQCTISGNTAEDEGGGIYSRGDGAQMLVADSIISGNTGNDVDGQAAGFFSFGHNLVGDGPALGAFGLNTDIVGVTDPMLSPWGYYGGPTPTMHPLQDSPVIDAGRTTAGDDVDQRGFPRFVNHLTLQQDIGALEAGERSLVTSNQDGEPNLGLTLREAIERAEPGEVIVFNSGIYANPINLVQEGPTIEVPVFIDASFGSGGMTISGGDEFRIFRIAEGAGVGMVNLHLTEGFARQDDSFVDPHDGGAIFNEGRVTLADCEISHCATGPGIYESAAAGTPGIGDGAGIASFEGFVKVVSSVIRDCATGDAVSDSLTSGDGAGIYAENAVLIVEDSEIRSNQTGNGNRNGDQNDGGHGGAIYCFNSRVTLDSTILRDNRTGNGVGATFGGGGNGGDGAGANFISSALFLRDCLVTGNITGDGGASAFSGRGGHGAGIRLSNTSAIIRDSRIDGNTTGRGSAEGITNAPGGSGAGIYQSGGSLRLEESQVIGNTAGDSESGLGVSKGADGGGIYSQGGSLELWRATVAHNQTGQGGDIQLTSISNGAQGGHGGGIYFESAESFMVLESTISHNRTGDGGANLNPGQAGGIGGNGAGIYTRSPFNIDTSTIAHNVTGRGGAGADPIDDGTPGVGGGVYWFSDITSSVTAEIAYSTVARNEARDGGGIRLSSGSGNATLQLRHSVVAQNVAGANPDLRATPSQHSEIFFQNENFVGVPPSAGNDFGTTPLTGNALLMALSDYGGPTWTMPPGPGSPLIDAATGSTQTYDQRFEYRDGTPDLGATESFEVFGDFVDTDNDEMDDRIEPLYGFVVGEPDGDEDADGDGSSNAAELKNLTSPHDNGSLLKIVNFSKTGSSVTLEWTSVPGLEYDILAGGAEFTFPDEFQVLNPATGLTHSANVLVPSSLAEQYFRVKRR